MDYDTSWVGRLAGRKPAQSRPYAFAGSHGYVTVEQQADGLYRVHGKLRGESFDVPGLSECDAWVMAKNASFHGVAPSARKVG